MNRGIARLKKMPMREMQKNTTQTYRTKLSKYDPFFTTILLEIAAAKTLPATQREERLPGWKGSILTVI
jgi:hypothetical protein